MEMTSSPLVSIPDGQEIINRVYVGGLPGDTSELELEFFFPAFEVRDVRSTAIRKAASIKAMVL